MQMLGLGITVELLARLLNALGGHALVPASNV